jgi:hypothetical protein
VIGVGERVGEERREATSEEEDEVNATFRVRVSVLRYLIPNSQVGGKSLRLRMENQDSNPRLPMFHCRDLKVLYCVMKEKNEMVSISRGNSRLVDCKGNRDIDWM